MINLEDLKLNVLRITSVRLCEIVVSCRYLGLDDSIIVLCMEQLSSRRENLNEDFDFETYIDQELAKLPPLDFKLPDMREIMSTITSVSKNYKK